MKSTGEPESGGEAPRLGLVGGIRRKRCPACRRGHVFGSLFAMHARCPVCRIDFFRGDPGYFTGAMYASYAMAIPLIAVLTSIEYLLLPAWSLFRLVLLASAISIPLVPWIWQYSRVLWIYLDRYFDPEEAEPDQRGPEET
jgi:uncharacterized protein (DUF983 family)